MKKFLNVLLAVFVMVFSAIPCFAVSLKDSVENIVSQDTLLKHSLVSISIRDASSGAAIYEKDSELLLHPASTLKTFTTYSVLKMLGKDYKLTTGLYFDNYGNVYIKLGADPMLTSKDLKDLFVKVKAAGLTNINGSIIIDDSIIDQKLIGVGWMWDDEISPYMPKFSPYNLDHNIVRVQVIPTKPNFKPRIQIKPYYPLQIENDAYTSNISAMKLTKKPWIDCKKYYLSGPIASHYSLKIPVNNPKDYFIYNLKKALDYSNINLNGEIKTGLLPKEASLVATINNSLMDALSYTNEQSDNLYAESLFKIAGGWYNSEQGTTKNSYKAFRDIYASIGADASHLDLVDASGVSHNNLITTSWMSNALHKIYKQPDSRIFMSVMSQPGTKGTLKYRLQDLQPYLWAKTGTLASVSGVTGYLKGQSGKMYSFSILIQNFKGKSSKAKRLEDKIIRQLRYY